MVDDRRPEDELEAHELRLRVRECLAELPPDEREAVTLHVFGELTVREVARIVGVSRSTSHERIRRGLKRLARRLQPLRGMVPGAPLTHLADGLRSIPSPPIPESLAAAATQTLSSVAAAQAALACTTGGIIMTKGTVALVVSTGIFAVTSVGLGIKLKTMESELTRARSTESNRVEQLVARQHRLELTNARLREEIARLGRAVSADGADDSADGADDSPPEQRGRAVDSETIRELLRQAEDAFVNRDAAAFRDTFLALVDVGPAAHAGLIELLRVTGNYNELFGEIAPDDYDFRRKFLDEVTRRRLQLGSLADAILTRDGEPDRATLFAYDLLKSNGVVSERSIDEQAATFLSLLERALDSEDDHFDPTGTDGLSSGGSSCYSHAGRPQSVCRST